MRRNKNRRRTEDDWSEIISAWESSGMSQREYAHAHEIPPHRLSYWKRKLRPRRGDEASFVELIESPSGVGDGFTISVGGDVKVQVPWDFDSEGVARLFSALGMRR